MNTIEIIKKAQKTHVEWKKFLEKFPDVKSMEEYQYIGTIEHHQKWIENYDGVINEIERLQDENEKLEKENSYMVEHWIPREQRDELQTELDDAKVVIDTLRTSIKNAKLEERLGMNVKQLKGK